MTVIVREWDGEAEVDVLHGESHKVVAGSECISDSQHSEFEREDIAR